MTKKELYKVSDILNDVLSNYLRGSETEEVLSRFEESISKSDMLQEKYNITGIKSRHATGKLKECIDNQTEERLEQTRKQLEENPQECMYARDNYTVEDRKVLCNGCEEECEFNKKKVSVSKDWSAEFDKILEPYKNSHNYNKLCLILRWWKSNYERWWQWKLNKKEEPVSEDMEEAAKTYAKKESHGYEPCNIVKTFKVGANWQKQQMMRGATDGQLENGEDYLRIKCLSMGCQPQDDGKLVKLIIIKEGKQ